MLSLALLLALLATAAPAPHAAAPEGGTQILRVLIRWRQAFQAGRLPLSEPVDQEGGTRIYGDLLPTRVMTHQQALIWMLDCAVREPSQRLVEEMTRLGAVAFEEGTKPVLADPLRVSELVVRALQRVKDPELIVWISHAAGGGEPGEMPRNFGAAERSVAIRALGTKDRLAFRCVIEAQLAASEPLLRQAAVEALREVDQPASVPALIDALEKEADPRVARAAVATLHQILQHGCDRLDVRVIRRAVVAAIHVLGRTDWRADLAAVDLLADFRSLIAVPALIDVLERFTTHKQLIARGELSTLLRQRAHETLHVLTGSWLPADQPAQWREFWEREKDHLVIPPQPERESGGTYARFFGLPVAGSRVVFIIDLSGSMDIEDVASGDGKQSRLDAAVIELEHAVGTLDPDASFNIVLFASDARKWRNDFVRPTAAVKAELHKDLHQPLARGGTNLFAGLRLALGIKSTTRGARYESNADEIFLLSDGEPNEGEVTDPDEILELIRVTNQPHGVVIHTVSMGAGAHQGFMKHLAEQNGGRFVTR